MRIQLFQEATYLTLLFIWNDWTCISRFFI